MANLPTRPGSVDPLVQRNPFRDRTYLPQPLETFAEARSRLPVPVLPDRPDWVEMYWRAWEIAWSHRRQPRADSGLVACFLDAAEDENALLWNGCFTTQFGLYGRRGFDFMGALDNFYARQHDDGFICREINAREGYDCYLPFGPNSSGPNILAWAEWNHFRVTGDDSRLSDVFWPLMAFHRWFRRHRTWRDGLYWATGASSGMSNQPRVPGGALHHAHYVWADASIQACLSCLLLSQMATMLDETELAAELAAERENLLREVNRQLWNPAAECFQDLAPDGRFSPARSLGAYWALLDKGLVSPKQVESLLSHLRDEAVFQRAHQLPCLAADSPGYEGATGDNYAGGVFSSLTFMVLKGLRHHGQHGLAQAIALNHLQNVCDVFLRTDTFWEYYAPDSVEPGAGARPNFVGWTGLAPITLLLEDVLGITIDWPLRRVVWDLRLELPVYGVRNYPLGPSGTMDLLVAERLATVQTDTPFTLTLQEPGSSLQVAVPAGTTEVPL